MRPSWTGSAPFQRRHPVIGLPPGRDPRFFGELGGYPRRSSPCTLFVSADFRLSCPRRRFVWVPSGRPDLQEEIIESALSRFPAARRPVWGQTRTPSGGIGRHRPGVLVSSSVRTGSRQRAPATPSARRGVGDSHATVDRRSRCGCAAWVSVLTAGLAIVGTTIPVDLRVACQVVRSRGVDHHHPARQHHCCWASNGGAVSRRMPPTFLSRARSSPLCPLATGSRTYGVVYIGASSRSSVTNGVVASCSSARLRLSSVGRLRPERRTQCRARASALPARCSPPFTDAVDLTDADRQKTHAAGPLDAYLGLRGDRVTFRRDGGDGGSHGDKRRRLTSGVRRVDASNHFAGRRVILAVTGITHDSLTRVTTFSRIAVVNRGEAAMHLIHAVR